MIPLDLLLAWCFVSALAGAGIAIGAFVLVLSLKRERQFRAIERAMSGDDKWNPARPAVDLSHADSLSVAARKWELRLVGKR
jgi:hypothetical protein